MKKVRIKLKDKVIVASWFELPGVLLKELLKPIVKDVQNLKNVDDNTASTRKKAFRFINGVILMIILLTCFIQYYPASEVCPGLNSSVLIEECFDTYPRVIWWFNWATWYRLIIWVVLMILTAYLNERVL